MPVIVDTSVWSLALRRNTQKAKQTKSTATTSPYVKLLKGLIQNGNASLFGAIRQEILSGIKDNNQYKKLATRLRAFPNISLTIEDHELAAAYFNTCRQKGIQGANTDFLICAVASQRQCPILTANKDFELFSQHLPIDLLGPQ